jgi:uncharacterized MnhB-related membrane protein
MKKYFYMVSIVILQTFHGSAVVILQWNLAFKSLIISAPIGFLTGLLFALLENENKKE